VLEPPAACSHVLPALARSTACPPHQTAMPMQQQQQQQQLGWMQSRQWQLLSSTPAAAAAAMQRAMAARAAPSRPRGQRRLPLLSQGRV
jgi:hypothetical protein